MNDTTWLRPVQTSLDPRLNEHIQHAAEPGKVQSWANALVFDTVLNGSSDIHISSQPGAVQIRQRIDGKKPCMRR